MNKHYEYNYETKEYLGEITLFLDPMATKREGKDVYSVPENSTKEAPRMLSDKNIVNIFNGTTWEQIPDYRNASYFDKSSALPVTLKLGESPSKAMTKKNPVGYDAPIWDNESDVWKEAIIEEPEGVEEIDDDNGIGHYEVIEDE